MLKDLPLWKNSSKLSLEEKKELSTLTSSQIEEAFSSNISFGTGGLRGLMGMGTNRINIFTVRKATLGLAHYLKKKKEKNLVIIACDTRNNSQLFVEEAAKVLASMGINVLVFSSFRPTPELSFAVLKKSADAGIVISASHNPPKYNGYKIYCSDGYQIVPHQASEIASEIEKIDDLFAIEVEPLSNYQKKGLIKTIPDSFDVEYIEAISKIACQKVPFENLKIVYSPLHGAGAVFGAKMLSQKGYLVDEVSAQAIPDPNFSTLKSPNPENPSAFEMALELAKNKNADIVFATDPDADRIGVGILHNKEYRLLDGNQIGALILSYLINHKKMIKGSVVISTIVTSDLIKTIANANGLRFIETLTGFKFIGEQITALKKKGGTFLFGCEESYGYLLTDEVRDKDAFQGMLIVAEMASFYKSKGHTLIDELSLINSKYGYYQEKLLTIDLFGIEGLHKINAIMDLFRTGETPLINALGIESIEDYLSGQVLTDTGEKIFLQLPKSDVIKFSLVKGGYFALRPSGTEPKLKIYLSIAGSSSKQTDKQLHLLENTIMQTIKEAGLL